MAQEIYIKVKVQDGEIDQTTNKLKKLGHEVEVVGKKAGKDLSGGFDKAQESAGNLQGGVEGVATEFINVGKAAKKGGAAMRSALISTGIGALVVVLGEIVANWETISNLITGANEELERQKWLSEDINNTLENRLFVSKTLERGLKRQLEVDLLNAKIQKKSEEEIFEIKKKYAEDLIALRKQENAQAQTDADNAIKADEKAYEAALRRQEESYDKLRDAEFELTKLVLEEKARRGENYQDRSDNTVIETIKARGAEEIEITKIISDEKVKILEDEIQKKLDLITTSAEEQKKIDQAVNDVKLSQAANTLSLLNQIVNEDSKAGKAFAAASTVISGIQGVQNAYTTAQDSPITKFFPAYPIIQAGLAGAFSALQLKKILSVDPTGKQTPNLGGNVGGGQAAPSFNVVGTSGVNQIAETLGQDQQPVQAYVVGSNVTSQQALDRNIIETATIG